MIPILELSDKNVKNNFINYRQKTKTKQGKMDKKIISPENQNLLKIKGMHSKMPKKYPRLKSNWILDRFKSLLNIGKGKIVIPNRGTLKVSILKYRENNEWKKNGRGYKMFVVHG